MLLAVARNSKGAWLICTTTACQHCCALHCTAQHSLAQHSTAEHAFQLQCCSPILQLSYGALGVRADVVSQHHKAQQLHVGRMGLHLLLSHAKEVQLMHIRDDTHCHGHQPEAVAAEPIPDLHNNYENNKDDDDPDLYNNCSKNND